MAVMQYLARQRDIIRAKHGRAAGAESLCAPYCGRDNRKEVRGAYAHTQARGSGQSAGVSGRGNVRGVCSSRGVLGYDPIAAGFAAAVLSRAGANCRRAPVSLSGHCRREGDKGLVLEGARREECAQLVRHASDFKRISRSGAVYKAAYDGRVVELLAEFGEMKGLNKRERAAYCGEECAD